MPAELGIQQTEALAKVVFVRFGEPGAADIQNDPVDDSLFARSASLGLPALTDSHPQAGDIIRQVPGR